MCVITMWCLILIGQRAGAVATPMIDQSVCMQTAKRVEREAADKSGSPYISGFCIKGDGKP